VQHNSFPIRGGFPVNPNTVRININGTIISYPDARLVFNASEQTMSYTPSTPFTDGATVSFYVQEAYDIQGCALNYAQHCQITVDRSAPILTIERGFTPACGSHITENDTIRFSVTCATQAQAWHY
jgi:hypothetical protein